MSLAQEITNAALRRQRIFDTLTKEISLSDEAVRAALQRCAETVRYAADCEKHVVAVLDAWQAAVAENIAWREWAEVMVKVTPAHVAAADVETSPLRRSSVGKFFNDAKEWLGL